MGADAGALFLVRSGRRPRLSLGDFDSIGADEEDEVRRFSEEVASFDPVDKNYTDTELALRRAMEWAPESILLLGATGTRLDHTLANIHLLRLASEAGINTAIEDADNRIRLLSPGQSLEVNAGGYEHVSLLPLSMETSGINLTGFKYPLNDASLASVNLSASAMR